MQNKLFKRIAASAIAAALAAAPIAALAETVSPMLDKAFAPVSAAEEPAKDVKVPEGYNEHDYLKLRAFLEIEDEDGVKNGEKLSGNYDPDDPETWRRNSGYDYNYPFKWTDDGGEKHIREIEIHGCTGSMDISGCTALERVFCGGNQLAGLDVSGCTALKELACTENQLTALNVNGCSALEKLACYDNQLTTLDVSNNPKLNALFCDDNRLTTLDVSKNPELDTLSCNNNQFTALNVSKNPELYALSCIGNQLTALDVSGNSELRILHCGSNQLTTLDVSKNSELEDLYCDNNKLTALNVSSNPKLYYLFCDNNRITELDLSNNTWLSEISCHGNRLTKIDLNGCDNICAIVLKVSSAGNGWIGFGTSNYEMSHSGTYLSAVPMPGCTFEGWYSPDGKLLETEPETDMKFWDLDYDADEVIAKFSGEPVSNNGDIDGDGEVTTGDALATIRNAMGLQNMSAEQIAAADMDGDGEVTTSDALMIIRLAMGLNAV